MTEFQILFSCAFLWLCLSAFWLRTLVGVTTEVAAARATRLRIWLIFALGEMAVAAAGQAALSILAMTALAVAGCVEIARVSRHSAFAAAGYMLAVPCAWLPPLLIGLALASTSVVIFLLPFKATPANRRAATLLLGFYVGLAPVTLYACRDRPGLLLAALLTLTTSHMIDIVSGFAGKRAGGRRPLARLSPNKTLRGFTVGCALAAPAGLALAVPLGALTGAAAGGAAPRWQYGILLGIGLWAITALGDLVGSKVKRVLQVKDYGTCLGPHGGFMDRLDAFVPAVIAGCLVVA